STTLFRSTGTQFAVPYVFKTLFSKEPIVFDDMCETKSVQKGAIYLDKNERLPEGEHNYIFVGRVGQFTPVSIGFGGGDLLCKRNNTMVLRSSCPLLVLPGLNGSKAK